MPDVIYYVACSVDGFIADEKGSVDWLGSVEADGEDYGYADFFESIDALVMGSRTYEQVVGFGDWPYGTKLCWVLSKRPLAPAAPAVRISPDEPDDVLSEIERSRLARVWLVGGSQVAGAFLEQGLISHLIISVIPVALGRGIPLFQGATSMREFALKKTERYKTGVVQVHYSARQSQGV
jgi:dihydrofolate reductase